MDIYRFINSADIAAHLKSIGYHFSALESAWLIWQSNTASMKERHEAWLALIDKFPDCSIEKSIRHPYWESLHQMLRDYMALEEKLRAILVEQDIGAAYIYDEYGPTLNGEKKEWYGGCICKDFWGAALYAIEREETLPYRIRKRWFGEETSITGYYDENQNLLRIEQNLDSRKLSDREQELWWGTFSEMYFDFPIPFKKGDLVQNTQTKEPFVLMDTSLWQRLQAADPNHCGKPRHPGRDMYAFGYSYDEKNRFLWDGYMTDCMDLEYCTEPLVGHSRILEAYSCFEKGWIDAWTLLKLFRMYECEAVADKNYRQLKGFGAVK